MRFIVHVTKEYSCVWHKAFTISHNKDVKQCNICIKKLIIEQMTLRMYYYFS